MDPQHSQDTADARRKVSNMAAAANNAEEPPQTAIPGLSHHGFSLGRPALSGVGKVAMADDPKMESTLEGGIARESWASFASTAASRDSGVPSIFSARASTASAFTRYSVRQSLMESPTSPTSPIYQEHRKSSFPQCPRYYCTFCDAAFDTKTEWTHHEVEFHERCEHLCGRCSAMLPGTSQLAEHLTREHGLDSADAAAERVQHSPIRSAWGCGFCVAVITSRSDYLEHVGGHYDDGRERSEWQHTRVIEGLLQQSDIASAWMALVNKEEESRGTKLRFLWDPSTTGRSLDARMPLLQDMLESFTTGTRTSDEVAEIAFSSAHIRPEGNVSDLISKLYLRNNEPKSAKLALTPIQPSPELQPTGSEAADDVVSPISPLPAPLQSLTLPLRSLAQQSPTPHSSFSTVVATSAPTVAKSIRKPSAVSTGNTFQPTTGVGDPTPPRLKQNTLRRIDSARDLGLPKHVGASRNLDRPADPVPLGTPSSAKFQRPSPISVQRTPLQPRLPAGSEEPSATNNGSVLLLTPNTTSSVRTHTSSSTLSTRTRDSSQRPEDSTSEVMSDDSLSEPDSRLGSDGIPRTTKLWRDHFQQTLTQSMDRIWARYNFEWDALIRECMGNTGGDSTQFRDSSGRVRKGASSRQGPRKGLRPPGGSRGQEDDDEDDDGESYRTPSSSAKRSPECAKRFACPFRKHDPTTYNIHDQEVCAVRSWSTISRLKEHLYRRHYKVHCPRCKQTFSDVGELAEHEMSVVRCEVLDMAAPSDITTYQEKQLKSRKHTTRRQTDEEKWRDIYRLLFPNEDIPSPYPEPAHDLMPTTSESHVSLSLQHFLLNEMPSLFTKTAEEHAGRHLQAHDGLRIEAIPRIIEETLHKAFRTWESRGNELPTREASVASMTLLGDAPTSLPYRLEQSTAYQVQQPAATMNHDFPQGHFGSTNFVPEVPHASQADDSGFSESSFFTSGPPVNYNAFAPQYERGGWETGLDLMGAGAFEADANMGGPYRGFQGN